MAEEEKIDLLSQIEGEADGTAPTDTEGDAPKETEEGALEPQGDDAAKPESTEKPEGQRTDWAQKAYMAEKKKRQAAERRYDELNDRLSRIEQTREEAKKIESSGLLDKPEDDQSLTEEEKEARRYYNILRDRLAKDLDEKVIKPALEKTRNETYDIRVEQAVDKMKDNFKVSDERIDQILDFAEERGIRHPDPYRILENAYLMMIGEKIVSKRSAEPSSKEGAKTVGGSTVTTKEPLITPYDPEKDMGKSVSQLAAEAVEELRAKGKSIV